MLIDSGPAITQVLSPLKEALPCSKVSHLAYRAYSRPPYVHSSHVQATAYTDCSD